MSATFALELHDVCKSYGKPDGTEHPVITDLDFRARDRQFISLVGPSGCGKSTLFRMLLGMEEPTRGTVKVAGEVVKEPSRRRGIVFQNYSLFPHLKVIDNVIFGLELERIHFLNKWLLYPKFRKLHKTFMEQGMAFLERFRLAEHAHKYPHELSGGMRQRVAIAQALIMEPDLLLLDEPFGALDDDIRRQSQSFLDEAYRHGTMTVIFVTHNVHEAVLLGDRVIVLSPFYRTASGRKHGSRIVFDAAVDLPRPRTPDMEALPLVSEMVQELRKKGLDPDEVQPLTDFRLSHPDSWRTVDPSELGKA